MIEVANPSDVVGAPPEIIPRWIIIVDRPISDIAVRRIPKQHIRGAVMVEIADARYIIRSRSVSRIMPVCASAGECPVAGVGRSRWRRSRRCDVEAESVQDLLIYSGQALDRVVAVKFIERIISTLHTGIKEVGWV